MTTEDYCSYEVAKLLKEKGFDVYTPTRYDYDGGFHSHGDYLIGDNDISAPTHQMAMKWLREVYDLHIIAYPFKSGNDTSIKHYCCQVFKTFNLLGCERYIDETLTSYEEAVEAALKYSLENLI